MVSKSENVEITGLSEKIKSEKPFDLIVQNLEMTFGEPKLSPKSDLLAMLINIILSQATTGTNSRRTFKNLKARFKNWEEVLKAAEEEIADAIRLGGLANQKAKVIKDLLKQIKENTGKFSLNFVEKMSAEEARKYLQNFRGIGPKTAACTLLFASHKEVFPLDTHIFRIFKRIGILPQKITDAKAHEFLDKVVPSGKFYSLHVNLIKLGKKICRPQNPLCFECPLIEYYDFGLTQM
jgi:endonuclease-3